MHSTPMTEIPSTGEILVPVGELIEVGVVFQYVSMFFDGVTRGCPFMLVVADCGE